jgi:hypothetical protein
MKTLYILAITLAHGDPHYIHVSGFTSVAACEKVSHDLDVALTAAGERPVRMTCDPTTVTP